MKPVDPGNQIVLILYYSHDVIPQLLQDSCRNRLRLGVLRACRSVKAAVIDLLAISSLCSNFVEERHA